MGGKGGQAAGQVPVGGGSHPMARRVAVRDVLNEDRKRFDRVKGFRDRQLENILE